MGNMGLFNVRQIIGRTLVFINGKEFAIYYVLLDGRLNISYWYVKAS